MQSKEREPEKCTRNHHDNRWKEKPKSVWGTNVVIQSKKMLKLRETITQFLTEEYPESGQNWKVHELPFTCYTNVTSKWKRILQVHKIIAQHSNDTQSLKSAKY